jgi:Tol biopolymer transport system component
MRFVSTPAISPDGRLVVFAAGPESGGDAHLWLRPLRATTAAQLPGTRGATFPFWSPNGRSVGFFADAQLKRIATDSGNPVIVCPADGGRGGLWLEDETTCSRRRRFPRFSASPRREDSLNRSRSWHRTKPATDFHNVFPAGN